MRLAVRKTSEDSSSFHGNTGCTSQKPTPAPIPEVTEDPSPQVKGARSRSTLGFRPGNELAIVVQQHSRRAFNFRSSPPPDARKESASFSQSFHIN